jgi:glycosyltransferase involved in cell wall biosynthesis
MNIGLVTPYYPDSASSNSGLANHFALLAKALVNRGHRVVVLHIAPAGAGKDSLAEQSSRDGVILYTYAVKLPALAHRCLKSNWAVLDLVLKLKCMCVAARKIRSIRRAHQLEIIETTSYFSLGYFYLFRKQRIPVVTRVSTTFLQMMDTYYPFSSRAQRYLGELEIKMIRKSRFLITHAGAHATELARLYDLNAAAFRIIPHGIDLPRESETDYGKKGKILNILYVGRFEFRKGTDTLLEAIPLILKQNPAVNFQLIGLDPDGEYETNFKSQVHPDLYNRVTFSGHASDADTQKAYSCCDFFVAPSRY